MHLETSQQGSGIHRSAARKRFEARFRRLIDMVPQMVLVKDDQGRCLAANKAAARIFGLEVAEIVGRKDEELLSRGGPGLRDDHRCVLDGTLPTADIPFALRQGKRSGILSVALETREQTAAHLDGMTRDAETRRLESLSSLAGGVAHEFNNLLVGVLGNTELAQGLLPEDHSLQGLLSDVRDAGEHIAALSQQLLVLSGRSSLRGDQVDLPRLVQESLELDGGCVPSNIELDAGVDGVVPPVLGDAAQLREVFLCILRNAVEAHAGAGGKIRVRVSSRAADASQFACLEVTDAGCGMDHTVSRRMFDPYFTTKGVGRGLEMALALGIVRGHHGFMGVQSSRGSGTRISVLLPAEGGHPLRHCYAGLSTSPSSLHRAVLLAESGRELRRQLRHRLERAGFQVLVADTWQEALRVFRLHAPHIRVVLLCESVTGGDTGVALRDLQRVRPDIPVIAVRDPACLPGQEEGRQPAPHEPFDASRLLEQVECLATGVSRSPV